MSRQPTHARANDVSFLSYVLRHLSIEAVIWVEFPRMASSISRRYTKVMALNPKFQRMGQRPGSPWVYVYGYRFDRSTILLSVLIRLMMDFDHRALSQECRSCATKANPTPKTFCIQTAFNAPLNSLIIQKLKVIGRISSQRTVPQANVSFQVASFHAIF